MVAVQQPAHTVPPSVLDVNITIVMSNHWMVEQLRELLWELLLGLLSLLLSLFAVLSSVVRERLHNRPSRILSTSKDNNNILLLSS